jgi:hypothetical protein
MILPNAYPCRERAVWVGRYVRPTRENLSRKYGTRPEAVRL